MENIQTLTNKIFTSVKHINSINEILKLALVKAT